MMMILKYFLSFFIRNFFFFGFIFINGLIGSVNAQTLKNSLSEEDFAFKVKQIDEFFERFNNNQTLLKDYIFNNFHSIELERKDLIKSLFDRESSSILVKDVAQFIDLVNDPKAPILLSFNDEDWYAWVKCSILYQNELKEIFLLLKVQKDNNQALKWIIQNAYADFLTISEEINPDIFLNPISHGTDFMGLKRAFDDPKNLRSYLPSNFHDDQLSKFVLELQNKQVEFQKIEEISYHFFQINGWILTVKKFQREGKNSGWLISNLISADDNEKKTYKKQVLKF